MPIIQTSSYKVAPPFRNAHVQTMYPFFMRKVKGVKYTRKTINTPDGDFIDLDLSTCKSDKLVILLHGLEGSSEQSYIKGMVKFYNSRNHDCVAMNLRSCSGRLNKLHRFYHMGSSDDLRLVVNHMASLNRYKSIYIIGFSLGGNIAAKYLGEEPEKIPVIVKKAALFSTPVCLHSAASRIEYWSNIFYKENFLYTMKKKVLTKNKVHDKYPIAKEVVYKVKTFADFDNYITAPLHGFQDAKDYWSKTSCLNYLNEIKIPTLLVNAKNDPLLGDPCYPTEIANTHKNFYLEVPKYGGHVGFVLFNKENEYWSEKRSYEFFYSNLN